MALRDTWHKALVYFGLAEDHDYGPEYEEDFEPETGSEEVFETRRERDQGSVPRPPTSRRARRALGGRPTTAAPAPAATSRSISSSPATSTTPSRSPTSSNDRCR